MRVLNETLTALALSLLMLGMSGCTRGKAEPTATDSHAGHSDADEHGHEHSTHGPHGGDLIELGGDDYHAELVHTVNNELVIYLLSSDAKTALPIEATEIIVNAMHESTPEQFKLEASAAEGDPEGKSSRFTSSDEGLVDHVHDEAAQAKIVVTIDGKQCTGKIAHDHDHGHSHE